MKLKYIDLFAGMGGIRLGLEEALNELGMTGECVLTSEIKPYALDIYKQNFGNENIVGDITKIVGNDIPDFDMLLAGFPCFIANTQIYTSQGYRAIQDIRVGDLVLTHTNTYKEVLEVMQKSCKTIYEINLGDNFEKLIVTGEHPFYVKNSYKFIYESPNWKKAKDLNSESDLIGIPKEIIDKKGMKLLMDRGHWFLQGNIFWVSFKSIKKVELCDECNVYNLCVAEDNSYTANNIIVHNCQPFSSAGKQRGFEDTRGTMFFEVARILKEKQPKYFLLENVENLVVHDLNKEDKIKGKTIGKTLETILFVLKELGYNVTWKVLQASDFGLAQIRRRIYIVGSKNSEISLDNFLSTNAVFGDIQEHNIPYIDSDYNVRLRKYLNEKGLSYEYLYDKAVRDKRGKGNNIHGWELGLRGDVSKREQQLLESLEYARRQKQYEKVKKGKLSREVGLFKSELFSLYTDSELNFEKDIKNLLNKRYLKSEDIGLSENVFDINGGKLSYEFTKILDPNKISLTLVATDIHKLGVVDNDGVRKLTLRECLRLNGYPDDYKFNIAYNKGIDLLGNTVAVPVIKAVCKRILGCKNIYLDKCKKCESFECKNNDGLLKINSRLYEMIYTHSMDNCWDICDHCEDFETCCKLVSHLPSPSKKV